MMNMNATTTVPGQVPGTTVAPGSIVLKYCSWKTVWVAIRFHQNDVII